MQQDFLFSKSLSLKAKGLLSIASTLQDGEFSVKWLKTATADGTTAIYSALNELIAQGYCSVEVIRQNGIIVGNKYTFTVK